ncbi:MAG: hypothetical protein U9N83_19045, partial [Thermodesulfobacteriota bacterium]|nr:hypothetical protein [Thermodesulfobacteriota bacterium]
MKQKYLILKDGNTNELTIREFVELDERDVYSLACEETYDGEIIKSAITSGKEALISTLRTTNLYPPGSYAEKISESVINLYSSENDQSQELFFDDKDYISKGWKKPEKLDDVEDELIEPDELFGDEQAEIDELLGEDKIKGN